MSEIEDKLLQKSLWNSTVKMDMMAAEKYLKLVFGHLRIFLEWKILIMKIDPCYKTLMCNNQLTTLKISEKPIQ